MHRGVVRPRTQTPEPDTREVVREEAGTVKKVQVIERDTMQTNQRIIKRDHMIQSLSTLVCDERSFFEPPLIIMQVKSQAAEIQELLASCARLQALSTSADQRILSTEAAANAIIEQMKHASLDTNKELEQARMVAKQAEIGMEVASQRAANSIGMPHRSPASALHKRSSAAKLKVTFLQHEGSENQMDGDDETETIKEVMRVDKGKAKATEPPQRIDNEEV
jgi:hypothetical protein